MNIDIQGIVFFSPSFIPRFYDAISIIVVFYLTVVSWYKYLMCLFGKIDR
jgi:hypothetical protein